MVYTGDGPDSDTDFRALWNGATLLEQYFTVDNWIKYTFDVSGTGSDTLTFEGYNYPSFFQLSDVSVTADDTEVTPEPSSFLLLGTGLLGVAGMLRRRFV